MSGLLEWCEGTMPIGEYLVANIMGDESPGAHCRYRPDDYTALESRRHMAVSYGTFGIKSCYHLSLHPCEHLIFNIYINVFCPLKDEGDFWSSTCLNLITWFYSCSKIMIPIM